MSIIHEERVGLLSELDGQASGSARDADDGDSANFPRATTLFRSIFEPSSPSPILSSSEPGFSISRRRICFMFPVLNLGCAVMTADAAVEYASYFQIGSAFNQLRHVSWLTLAFVIMVTVTQPLYSRISDIYGRKPLILLNYLAFGVGIIMCTLSYNFWILVFARGVVGSGSAGMDIVPLRQRALWQSGLSAGTLLGQTIGGILGSLVVDKLGWRIYELRPLDFCDTDINRAFLLEVPMVPILLIWGAISIRVPKLSPQFAAKDVGIGLQQHLKNGLFDVSGTGLFVCAIASLVLALNLGGNDLAWSHPLIPTLFAASVTFLVTFVWVELRVAKVPLVPVRLIATKKILPIMGTAFFSNALIAALLYTIPYYVNVSGRGKATVGGSINVVLILGETAGEVLSGALITWRGRPWNVHIVASIVSALSTLWIQLRWSNSEGIWEDLLPIIIGGVGLGATTGSLLVSLLKSTNQADRAIMYGSFHIFSTTASMSAISCISALIQNQFGKYVREDLDSGFDGDAMKLIGECMKSIKCLDSYPENVQNVIRGSFVQALGDSFTLILGIATLAIISAMFMNRHHIVANDK